MLTTRNSLIKNSLFLFSKKQIPRVSNACVLHTAVRLFATDADIKKQFQKSQIIRTSKSEPKATQLIRLIRDGDYDKAKELVATGVDVNGHNSMKILR